MHHAIIFALKTYAYKHDDTPETINLKDNIDLILTIYQNQFKYGINLETSLEDNLMIEANPDAIGQIWTNIIHMLPVKRVLSNQFKSHFL